MPPQTFGVAEELSVEPFKELTVVIDQDGSECLYVNGECWEHTGETTVYSCDLAKAAGENPVILKHVSVELPEYMIGTWNGAWPKSLSEVLKYAV